MNKFNDFSKKLKEISENFQNFEKNKISENFQNFENFEKNKKLENKKIEIFYIKYKYQDRTKYPEIFSLYKKNQENLIQGNPYNIALIKKIKDSYILHKLLKDIEYIEIKCYYEEENNSWVPIID